MGWFWWGDPCCFSDFEVLGTPFPAVGGAVIPAVESKCFRFMGWADPPTAVAPVFAVASLSMGVVLTYVYTSLLLLFYDGCGRGPLPVDTEVRVVVVI